MLAELKNKDPATTLDVYYRAHRAVADKTHGNMTPQMARLGDGDGMFAFVPQAVPFEDLAEFLGEHGDRAPADPDRGLAGAEKRVRRHAQQMTTPAEAYEALDALDYRLSDRVEDLQKVWEE